MSAQQGSRYDWLQWRGTLRLLDHLAAFERLLRLDERPARRKVERVLGHALTARVLADLFSHQPRKAASSDL